jgi:hypothetical protein
MHLLKKNNLFFMQQISSNIEIVNQKMTCENYFFEDYQRKSGITMWLLILAISRKEASDIGF